MALPSGFAAAVEGGRHLRWGETHAAEEYPDPESPRPQRPVRWPCCELHPALLPKGHCVAHVLSGMLASPFPLDQVVAGP